MSDILVFSYGTLMRGQRADLRNYFGGEFIGEHEVQGTLYSLGTFPYLVLKGDNSVKGELFSVTPDQLKEIDEYERYPNLYQRAKLESSYGDFFVYHMEHPFDPFDHVIETGDWRQYQFLRNDYSFQL